MILKLCSLLFVLFLNSCSKYKAGDVIDGEDIVPPHPPFMTKFTLEGADADNDGVRDDVEIWINENVEDSNMRKLAKQETRVWQARLQIKSQIDAYVYIALLEKKTWCRFLFEGGKYIGANEIDKVNGVSELIHNNYFRNKRSREVEKFIPSYTMPRSLGNPHIWMKSCDFQIYNSKDVVRASTKSLDSYPEMTVEEKKELLQYLEY